MSTEAEEKQMVEALKQTMLEKLAKNRNKTPWAVVHPSSLHAMMSGKSCELFSAMLNGDIVKIMEEAANVANFAGMIHDLARRSLKEEARWKD